MLQKTFQTRGLIIRKRSYRETDKVVVVLSPEYGRLEILIRGARKSGNYYSGILEPMMLGDFSLTRGRIWDGINDLILREDYSVALGQKEMVVYQGASFILKVLDKMSIIDVQEKNFFGLAVSYLEGLTNDFQVLRNSDKMKMYLCSFVLSILAVSGRLPCFLGCTVCAGDYCGEDDGWNLAGQGLIHRHCLLGQHSLETTLVLTDQDKGNLENLLVLSGENFLKLKMDSYEVQKLVAISLFLLSEYIGREIKMAID